MARLLARAAQAAAVLLPLSLALAGGARADDPTRRGFDPDTSRMALTLDGGMAVETAGPAAPGTRAGGVLLDYAEGLLALRLAGEREQLLRSRLSAQLFGGYAFERFELGAHLPVALWQRSDVSLLRDRGVTGGLVEGVSSAALGDLRLLGKLPLLAEDRAPLAVAALLDLRLPTGNRKAFTSDGLSATPGVVATRTLGRFRLDGQLGYWLRGQGQYAQLVAHDGFTGGLGASANLGGFGRVEHTRAMVELLGGLPRGYHPSSERYKAPLSVRAGVRAFLPSCWAVDAGAGTGIGKAGYGREAWRVFAGLRWSCARREEQPASPAPAPPPPPSPPPEATSSDEGPDWDGDGVPNELDLCPRDPGPPELDGCPDRDGDGIPDREDKCPDEPGPAVNDGCPVKGPLVEIETEKLSLKDAILFDYDRATIKPESNPVLDAIATLLRDHPELKRIRVEGHTDSRGTATYNKDLSLRRARSVVKALTQRGIAAERLTYEGYGFERPVADNKTALGRAKNRRVEFTILQEAK